MKALVHSRDAFALVFFSLWASTAYAVVDAMSQGYCVTTLVKLGESNLFWKQITEAVPDAQLVERSGFLVVYDAQNKRIGKMLYDIREEMFYVDDIRIESTARGMKLGKAFYRHVAQNHPEVKLVSGHMVEDNLAAYNEALNKGELPEEALKSTPHYKMAAASGFSYGRVRHVLTETGEPKLYIDVFRTAEKLASVARPISENRLLKQDSNTPTEMFDTIAILSVASGLQVPDNFGDNVSRLVKITSGPVTGTQRTIEAAKWLSYQYPELAAIQFTSEEIQELNADPQSTVPLLRKFLRKRNVQLDSLPVVPRHPY